MCLALGGPALIRTQRLLSLGRLRFGAFHRRRSRRGIRGLPSGRHLGGSLSDVALRPVCGQLEDGCPSRWRQVVDPVEDAAHDPGPARCVELTCALDERGPGGRFGTDNAPCGPPPQRRPNLASDDDRAITSVPGQICAVGLIVSTWLEVDDDLRPAEPVAGGLPVDLRVGRQEGLGQQVQMIARYEL